MKRIVFLVFAGILATAMIAPVVASPKMSIEELKTGIGYAFLGLAFVLATIAYANVFIGGRKGKKREEEKAEEGREREIEEIIKILKETKRIKEEIEKREALTSEIARLKILRLSNLFVCNGMVTLIFSQMGALRSAT